jgi:hypothetical protein
MDLAEAPLLFDELDRGLYIRRAEPEFWLRSAVDRPRGGGWLLLGGPGTGKTTLLRWLKWELQNRVLVGWVDAGTAASIGQLLALIATALNIRIAPADDQNDDPQAIQQQLQALRGLPHACVLIDNLADHEAAFGLFGRMRDVIWASHHTFIVTGRLEDVAVLRRPPADAFFSHALRLGPPDEQMLRELGRNAGAKPEQTQRLVIAQPPSLRAAVRALNTPALMDGTERWREQLAAVRPAAAVVAEQILELDRAVSADDHELQARTGLRAIALRRYLRSLERDGLLRVIPERDGQPGRPRLLYQVDLGRGRGGET